MARPLRIQYEGAWYHATNRGAARRATWHAPLHRELFLDLLGEASEAYGWEVHGYCLMDNHYHLLVRTPRGNLARAMRHLDGVYTQRLNRLLGTDGPLFRGRYDARLIEADAYLLAVSRYIHRNPVEAGIVPRPEDHAWSSYPAYLGCRRAPRWLHTDAVLEFFGRGSTRDQYRRYVESADESGTVSVTGALAASPALGCAQFIESLASHAGNDPEIPQRKALVRSPPIGLVVEVVAQALGVGVDEILRAGRRVNHERAIAMRLCRMPGGHGLREIAAHFGVGHYSSVSVAIRRLRQRMDECPELSARFERARSHLEVVQSQVKT